MLELGVDPIALNLGFIEIRWYGIMVVLAVLSIVAISLVEAKRRNIEADDIYNLTVWSVISAVIFARLFHVIDNFSYYIKHPLQILTNFEGLAVYGAVFGIILAFFIYCRVRKLPFWTMGDLIAPGALVGMAVGRVGCLFNGCCYGLPADLPFSVVYTNPNSYAPIGIPMHPTQIYHIIWNLLAFGAIWGLRKHVKATGVLFLLYLAFYAAGDLTVRFFRVGEPFLFGMQQAQVIGILILIITVPWIIARACIYRKKAKSVVEPEVSGTEQSPED